MILAVDIGNSNIVIGCFDRERILLVERVSTNRSATVLEYAVILKTVLELNGLSVSALEGGIISSVVPSVTNAVKAAIEKLTGKTPLVVGPGLKTGLRLQVENPAQLGSDRIVDAVAAVSAYPCPLITIDMGTATTISVVDGSRTFIGGLIMPGLRVSTDALADKAAQLPHIELAAPDRAIGRGTVECMKSGVIYGCAAMLDGLVGRIQEELGQKCTVVATGGLAELVVPYCQEKIVLDSQLLLKGLLLLYRKNRG